MQSKRKAQAKSETATKQSFSIHYQIKKLILQANFVWYCKNINDYEYK